MEGHRELASDKGFCVLFSKRNPAMRAAAGVLPLAASLSTPIVPTRIAATDTDRVVWSCAAILLIAFAPSLQSVTAYLVSCLRS